MLMTYLRLSVILPILIVLCMAFLSIYGLAKLIRERRRERDRRNHESDRRVFFREMRRNMPKDGLFGRREG